MAENILHKLVVLSMSGGLLLGACGAGGSDTTPTIAPETIQTQAVATFAFGLTQTAIAMPTETPLPTETPKIAETIAPAVTNTPGFPSGPVPTASCYGLAFVADVTIPDNTNMKPGEKFTKTWKVKNNGSCDWASGFKFRSTGTEALGGATLTLDKSVSPGKEMELSVAMTAPSTAGTYRSNWRMSTAEGNYFGDEVYVIIVVGGTASSSSTHTQTKSPAAASATPTITEATVETTES
jgi:hypothetical protein